MKHNKFSKFIERSLICLPLLYIGIQATYITFNPNAKDSYYGETINESNNIMGYESLEETYYLNIGSTYIESGSLVYNVRNVEKVAGTYTMNFDITETKELYFYKQNDIYYLRIALNDNTYKYIQNRNGAYNDYVISFDLVSVPVNNVFSDFIYYIEYNDYSYLNNALPYAMSEFNKLGFGKLDFTSWFVNIFHNGNTNVYISFVNSYLNYFLFVECCYFIPMILYWFIHFGERVIDKFSNKEYWK